MMCGIILVVAFVLLFHHNSGERHIIMDKDRSEEIAVFINNLKMGRPFLTEDEMEIVKRRYPDLDEYLKLKEKEYIIAGGKYYSIKL